MTAGEERADGLLLLADGHLLAAAERRSNGDRYQVILHVDETGQGARDADADPDPDADANADDADRRRQALRCELEEGVPLALETARRITCDASIVPLLAASGRSPDIGRKRRTIPPALRRALAARDRGCRFPGCGARRFVDAHHVRHWADGGSTSMANLVQLCRHHHRLLHEGGFTISGHPGGELRFQRADGRRISGSPRPPRGRLRGVLPRRGEPRVEPTACASLSGGERLDRDLGVEALLAWTLAEPDLGAQEAVGL